SYNADIESLRIALDFLHQQTKYQTKTLILSDIQQTGIELKELYPKIFQLIKEKKIDRFIGIGTDLYKFKNSFGENGEFYFNTNLFIKTLQQNPHYFSNEAILLKGARMYHFENLLHLLEYKQHQTVLEVNLNAIIHNYNYFKSLLLPQTKICVMVKAFSYGSGIEEIASVLQHNKVDYLAVAFTDEGVELRKAGIRAPIIVMSPEAGTFSRMVEYNLEPEIYNFRSLQMILDECKTLVTQNAYPVHIKINTGMNRMGFDPDEVHRLLHIITENKETIFVKSVFSHLAASDDPDFDTFTMEQISVYEQVTKQIQETLGYTFIRHILNSAGIERFPQAQYDMVRLGIGLYGISTIDDSKLENVSTLKTNITQIRTVTAGSTVGYGRRGKVTVTSQIAVIPIGYADGLNRKYGNGNGYVLVKGQKAPIVGSICMDMCMIDVTGLHAHEGDEVIIIGQGISFKQIANTIGTIPYEIFTSISQRVKRVYVKE
ncbi:MAG: alanine racemase, partial [Bacteroidales bacterium]